MNIDKLEKDLQALVINLIEESFIYDLLLAYGQPKSSITRLQKGDYNLSKKSGEILWKKKLFFKKETNVDLHVAIDELKNDESITKQHPRFIVITDFQTLLSLDTKTEDTLDIPIVDLAKHLDFFLPWAGMEKSQFQSENPADTKAAVRMGQLYDLILEDNPKSFEGENRHALNIFLSRLLFCFFAEDTGIFSDDQFTNAVASHTNEDGTDLQSYLHKLFTVLNLQKKEDYPQFLQDFPYVNGGLFADEYPVPKFSAKSRKIIIECGALNWKEINPDIFGSMMQAVVHTEQRSGMGMHYTSVVNIMKVIEPLFLNSLWEQYEKANSNEKKLEKLLERLYHLRIFDPACGSGNFLIISYKELCKLEIQIYKQLQQIDIKWNTAKSGLQLSQFFGIDLDDFAHETAKLSLWLTEHQMNTVFKEVFGDARPTLPLQDSGNIICGNATRLDWNIVCENKEDDEIYVLGNPPYLGSKNQSPEQKEDMKICLEGLSTTKSLDYIACWFIKASRYINKKSKFSFVATNSICQGTQVPLLWPLILNFEQEIFFAYKNFIWSNNAKNRAGVTCSIIGISHSGEKTKLLSLDGHSKSVNNISAYLIDSKSTIITKRANTISDLPRMQIGNEPYEGGFFIFLENEKDSFIKDSPESEQYFKKLVGSNELIKGTHRWCIWIEDSQLKEALEIPAIKDRINKVRVSRENGGMNARSCMDRPHQFRWVNRAKHSQIVVPVVSSERREYIPISFIDKETIISNKAQVIYDPELYVFSVINSRIHMAWVKTITGRIRNDYQYTAGLCYNSFPFPSISNEQKGMLEEHVFKVLEQRELHPEKTLAELYDPDKMPEGLRKAHHEMDIAVEQCYRARPFTSDEERLEYLFKLYEEMIAAESG